MSGTMEIANLMAQRDYAGAVPLLRKELEKYPKNVRLRLQLADALAGIGEFDEALEQYDATAQFYDESGLMVQAIGVRKKAEKVRAQQSAGQPVEGPKDPRFPGPIPQSPLFEKMSEDDLDALLPQMDLEQFEDGDVIITEGDEGTSLYVVVSGEVKVFTKQQSGENLYLAKLGSGDFFGEISLLTGRKRTATITAAAKTELLRLDREKFDELTKAKPHMREVLENFYEVRAKHTVEAMIESLKGKK